MHRTAHRLAFALLLVALSAACAPSSTATPAQASVVAPVPSNPPAAATEPTSATGNSAAEQRFVTAVTAIAPPLADNSDRLIRRGRNTCGDVTGPDADEKRAVSNAQQRFSGGSYTVNEDQARRIVDAARTTICAG